MPVFPNNVSLRQLRAFDEVARQGAFAPAARELCLTQSALSESIRQLEEALGMRLFDRTTRTVGLTSAGQAFLVDVRQAFDTLEQGFQNLGDLAALRRGKVRIAAAPSVLAVLLLPVLPALRAQYPGIEVDLIEDSAEGIAQRVQAGLVDFGVGAAHPAGGDLLTQPLVSDAMGLVARADEPLLQARRLVAADLAHLPFVGLTTDTAISQLLAAAPGMPANVLQPSLGLQGDLGFRLLDEPRILRRTLLIQRPRRALSPAAQLLFEALAGQVQTLARYEGIAPD